MDQNIKLHNINKAKLKIHLAKILELHDYSLELISKYVEEFKSNPEFQSRIEDLKEFAIEVAKGREHFVRWGVEGTIQDIESFPYECIKDTLPLTVSIGGGTKFWKLYSTIQKIAFEEIKQNLPRTDKTLWAAEIKDTISNIRNYYYYETIKSQLSHELLDELNHCLEHYIYLWEVAISKVSDAIKVCENDKENYIIPSLQQGKQNLELRKFPLGEKGMRYLIESLRESPISDPRRGTLDIARGMEQLLGNWRYGKKGDLGNEIADAVSNICEYFETGFGFMKHKRFSYEKLMQRSEEL